MTVSADTAGDTATEAFRALNTRLDDVGVEAELCLMGGAVMIIAFDADPHTRHVRALFRPTAEVRRTAGQVAQELALPSDWLEEGVRGLLGRNAPGLGPFLERSNLRVYEARPDYVLAMKAAAIELENEQDADADLRYIMRSMGLTRASEARERIGRYFSDRQLPQSLEERLERLLA